MLLCTARGELGLSTDEFYSMVPRTLAAFVKAHRSRVAHDREHTEYMFAQLTLWTAYSGMSQPSQPLEIRDFMPSAKARKPLSQAEQQAALTEQIRGFNLKIDKARHGR